MKLTNKQIYNYAEKLYKAFLNEKKYFPAKINFLIQKNKEQLIALHEEIEQTRSEVLKKYGNKLDDNLEQYKINEHEIDTVNQELNDLLEIEQEVNIYFIDLDDIEDLEFTPQQMDAILFMIKTEEEN